MIDIYLAGDRRGVWVKFMDTANINLPDELFEAMFGGLPARCEVSFHFTTP
jgi:hypothetical protein